MIPFPRVSSLCAARFLILSSFLMLAAKTIAASAPPLNLAFKSVEASDWSLERKVAAIPSLTFGDQGLRFSNEGFDLLSREWNIGTAPFEISADLIMTRGRTEQFNRSRGMVITLSTAPVDKMNENDIAIIFAVTQTGIIATAKQGGARLGAERRPGVWFFPGSDVGGRLKSSMAGQGGQDFSVRWPTRVFANTTIRLWGSRDAAGTLHLKIFNIDGAAAPWWEATVPEKLASADFRWLTVHTGREPADFKDLARYSLAEGQGNGPADGLLTRLQLRALENNKTTLDVPFPAAILKSDHPARSVLLKREALQSLRGKFNSPAFANYKTVMLRTATPEARAGLKMGQPDQNEAVVALTWALLLSQDKAAHLAPLLEQLDALIGPSDVYPKEEFEFPGHLRQNLSIREFWVQNLAALALAYDLVGDELGKERRDRIRFLLVRIMKSYHALLDDGDWWFGGNPSNTIGVGNGCLGIVGVVMREEQPELAEKTIERALANIEKLFLGVDPDGGCLEGAMYWNYGLGYPMLLGWSLRQTTGNDRALLSSSQVKNATQYLAVNFGGDDKMIPFNDTQPWIVGWPVLAACGTEADSPLARWMADHIATIYATGSPAPEQARATYTIPAFLYRDTKPAPKEFPGLPNIATLESVQEGVLRSDGSHPIPGMVTAVKGKGALSTHHANEDQGSFVFYVKGEMVLLDPGYFEATAQKHSLPLIGDPEKMGLSATTAAPLSDAWEQGQWRSVTVDATAAYNESKKSPRCAQRARRIFVQADDTALIILDDTLPLDAAQPITAQYQAGVPATVAENTATFATKSNSVEMRLFGPAITLTAQPREFAKNWIYKRSGIPWTTLRGAYQADEKRPLITILSTKANKPEVNYYADRITVTLGDERSIEFKKGPDAWQVVKPKS